MAATNLIQLRFRIDDVRPLLSKLSRFAPNVQRRVLGRVLSAAGTVVRKEARKLAPVGTGLLPSGEPRKHLRDLIKTKVIRYPNGNVVAVTGYDARLASHGNILASPQGARPHKIVGKPWLTWIDPTTHTRIAVRGTVKHPGHPRSDFLDRAAQRSIPQVKTRIRDMLHKHIHAEITKLI